MLNALCKLIRELEENTSLYDPSQLRERIAALDRLDFFNLEMLPPGANSALASAYRCARAIQAKLEAVNLQLYEGIRCDIRLGRGARSLLQWVPTQDFKQGQEYDDLDEILAGVFRFEEPGALTIKPAPEMIFYQPTPARHIFDLFDRAGLTENDVLIDLGSGLGHVPLLTSICTGARAIGVEIEPAYAASAEQAARDLNLRSVTFIRQDARAADLSEGAVFYLYTPFTGQMLRAVLDLLRCEGARRDIRICTFGPCTTTVANEDWLECVGTAQVDRISVFRSRLRRRQADTGQKPAPPPVGA